MADNKIYKRGGKFFEQDPQYDTQMKAEGYEDATPEETAVYLADERPSKPYDPSTQADEQDAALANEIEIAERAQGREVSKEDALLRAQNIRSIMGERPVYPEIDETLPSQEGDTGLTILDGVLGGLALGAPKFLVRKTIDLADALGDPTKPASTFSTSEMERRARANPSLLFGVELGTGLLQGGVGALKTAAPKAFAKLGLAGRLLESTDVAGRITGQVGKLVPPLLGVKTGPLAVQAATELEEAAAKRLSGEALSAAEKEVLETADEIGKSFWRGQVRPIATGAPAAGGRVAATLTKEGEKAAADRARFLLETKLTERYAAAGYGAKTAQLLAQTLANSIAGAGAGAITELQRKEAERTLENLSLSPQQQEEFLEDYGAALWRGVSTGGAIGGALTAGTPIVSKAFGMTLEGIKKISTGIAEKIIPAAGSLIVRNDPRVLQQGVKVADALGDINVMKEARALSNTLQYQHDYAANYLTYLQSLKSAEFPSNVQVLGRNLNDKLKAAEKFMVLNKDGKMVYDPTKVNEGLKKSEIVFSGGKPVVKLPPEIQDLQDEIAGWENLLIGLDEAYARSAGTFKLGAPIQEAFPLGTPPFQMPRVPSDQPFADFAPVGLQVGQRSLLRLGGTQTLERQVAERTTNIGQELASIGVPAIVASQFGLGAAEALGTGIGISQLAKLTLNPDAALAQFRGTQRLIGVTKEANKNFANWIVSPTRGRAAAGEAVRKSTTAARNAFSPELKDDEQLNEPFSLKAAKQLYQMDNQLLGRIAGPDAAGNIDAVFGSNYRRLENAYPIAGNRVAQITPKQVAFLNSKIPKPNGQVPSDRQIYEYGIYSRYVRDPDAIYDDIVERNYVPSQALEVLQKVYPSRLYQIQGQLIDAMAAMKERGEVLDSKQQRIADSILGKGNTAGLTPAQIKALQQQIQLPVGAAKEFSSRRPELEKQGLSPRK